MVGMQMRPLCCLKEHFLPLVSAVFVEVLFVAGWKTPIKCQRLHPNHVSSIRHAPQAADM